MASRNREWGLVIAVSLARDLVMAVRMRVGFGEDGFFDDDFDRIERTTNAAAPVPGQKIRAPDDRSIG